MKGLLEDLLFERYFNKATLVRHSVMNNIPVSDDKVQKPTLILGQGPYLTLVERPYGEIIARKPVWVLSVLTVVSCNGWKGGLSVQILLLPTVVRESYVVVLRVLAHIVVKVVSVHHGAHGVHQRVVQHGVVENSLVDLTHVGVRRHRLLFLLARRLSWRLRLRHLLFGLRHVLHVVRSLQLGHLILVEDWGLLVLLGAWLRLWLVVTWVVLLLNVVVGLSLLRGVVVYDGNIVAVMFWLVVLDYIFLLLGFRQQGHLFRRRFYGE